MRTGRHLDWAGPECMEVGPGEGLVHNWKRKPAPIENHDKFKGVSYAEAASSCSGSFSFYFSLVFFVFFN